MVWFTKLGNLQPQAREKAEKEGFEISIAKTSFKANTKALAENEGEGIAKVIYFPSKFASLRCAFTFLDFCFCSTCLEYWSSFLLLCRWFIDLIMERSLEFTYLDCMLQISSMKHQMLSLWEHVYRFVFTRRGKMGGLGKRFRSNGWSLTSS